MTNQKLYALKTSDTGEWVVWDEKFRDRPGYRLWDYPTEIVPEDQRFICRSAQASKDTGHPCEWVEVCVIEAKPVTEEVIESILTAQETIGMETPYQFTESLQVKKAQITWRVGFCNGFRACLRYLGVGVT